MVKIFNIESKEIEYKKYTLNYAYRYDDRTYHKQEIFTLPMDLFDDSKIIKIRYCLIQSLNFNEYRNIVYHHNSNVYKQIALDEISKMNIKAEKMLQSYFDEIDVETLHNENKY